MGILCLEKLNHRKSLQLRLRNLNICIEKVHAKCWNSRGVVASSPSFSRPAASAPQRAGSQAILPVHFLTFPNLLMITDIVYLLLPNDLILTYVNNILLWYYPACARRRVSLWRCLFTQSLHQSLMAAHVSLPLIRNTSRFGRKPGCSGLPSGLRFVVFNIRINGPVSLRFLYWLLVTKYQFFMEFFQ